MRRLVSTMDLPKAEWLAYRKMGITGTDAGAITGMNPYRSAFQVYLDKITDKTEEFDNESMRQGRDLEEYTAQRFSEETGLKVRRANAIYQNEKHPIMLADFDRMVIGQKAGLECKTVSPYSADKWADGKIPLHYQMQVQHYLAVSGFECWYICALIFGQALLIRKIDRDEELIQYLITIEERFWNENIMERIMPDPDGTKSCSEQISKLYFKSDARKTVELQGFGSILQRREELVELIDKLEKEKSSIDQRIQMELQEAAYGITPDYKVSWITAESRRLDTKRLKAERPEIYEQYCKVNSSRRFTVKHAA
ncbi:YqaJ viral recombinase family protein [Lachnospiraceae bacterium OttesenSCG-928-D06]|nr:YqaJ viral recombinase family protein [Lachnospiraceae bacterium OttesenSCG-928-D06]